MSTRIQKTRPQIRQDLELQTAFKRLFITEAGEVAPNAQPVLAFLRSFCFSNASVISYSKDGRVDAFAMAALAGRQEVWQQIYMYCNLSDTELLKLDRWLQQAAERNQEPFDNHA